MILDRLSLKAAKNLSSFCLILVALYLLVLRPIMIALPIALILVALVCIDGMYSKTVLDKP